MSEKGISLQNDFIFRPLEVKDYNLGFLRILSQLTTVGDVSEENFRKRLDYMKSRDYHIIVAEHRETGEVIATGTIFIEHKFIHHVGCVGHIEDIVVREDYRRRGIGLEIVRELTELGKMNKCYKIILNCSFENVPFYIQCGYSIKEVEMAVYIKS